MVVSVALKYQQSNQYVAEHGCKWRGLPKRFGNWHTICTRMNRSSKNEVSSFAATATPSASLSRPAMRTA